MEKLAVFKSVDEIIQLDEEIRPGEVRFMEELCESLRFEKAMLREARRVDAAQALAVLKTMPDPQKQALAKILLTPMGWLMNKKFDLFSASSRRPGLRW